jgi:undecaprenyl-diphosphatase
MDLIQALTLGLVQGITEFLPISSSGFLILIPELFGWEVQTLAFDAWLHLATLAAVVFALLPEVRAIFFSFFHIKTHCSDPKWRRLGWWIILATIPVVIVGFFASDFIEASTRSIQVVAWSFIIWGVVLYIVDRFAKLHVKDVTKVGWQRSLAIGAAQVIALIPGTSRSGITITAGLLSGLKREQAAKFSFLLGIPTIAAAGALKFLDVFEQGAATGVLPIIVGAAAAFITAFLTIKVLLSFLKRYTFSELAIFRIALGLLLLVL